MMNMPEGHGVEETADRIAQAIVDALAEHPDWLRGAYAACETICVQAAALGGALEDQLVAHGTPREQAVTIAAEPVMLVGVLIANSVCDLLAPIIPPCERAPIARIVIGGAYLVDVDDDN